MSKDLSHVIATASLVKQAESHLTENTRFWVVRARVTASQITGIGTIVSGAYIGMIPGSRANRCEPSRGWRHPPS